MGGGGGGGGGGVDVFGFGEFAWHFWGYILVCWLTWLVIQDSLLEAVTALVMQVRMLMPCSVRITEPNLRRTVRYVLEVLGAEGRREAISDGAFPRLGNEKEV